MDVVDDEGDLRIVRRAGTPTRGERLVDAMRGRATSTTTTDQLLDLLRGE